jgi:hypothetical protein
VEAVEAVRLPMAGPRRGDESPEWLQVLQLFCINIMYNGSVPIAQINHYLGGRNEAFPLPMDHCQVEDI